MRQTKAPKSSQKKKRYSQTKQLQGYEYKFSPYEIQNHTHNRSESIGPRKQRFKTDYEDYESRNAEDKNGRKNYYGSHHQNSYGGHPYQQIYGKRRNQTQGIGVGIGSKNAYKSKDKYQDRERDREGSAIAGGVQSTKSNPKKNLQLRLLFNRTKQGEQSKGKGYTAHHPLLKYVNKNKQYTKSPYTSQIQRFESLYAKMKNSASKGKRTPTNSSQHKNINNEINVNINKNQIRINQPPLSLKEKEEKQQETVKTIKKSKNQREKEKERQRQREKQKEREKEKDMERRQHTSKSKQSEDKEKEFENSVDEEEEDGFGLTQQEQQTFGNRFPYGFEKIKLLGRGGFSLVWLGRHIKSNKQFAIKQIITQNTHQTHIKQIWFGTNFFTLGGIPKPQFTKYPGIKNLVRMYSYEINQSDTWIFYEKCGNSLGSNLYDIKAERVYGQQRLYKIYYKGFYRALAEDPALLKSLIIQICKPLVVLSTCQIVHSDLKTQNILIKYQPSTQPPSPSSQSPTPASYKLTETKLIDYGSSFEFKNISQFSMATPEYMPPQILNYIIHENQGEYEEELYEEVMNNYRNPWIVDIFSLGCVLLEIVVGVPLWMSLPLLVPSKTGISYCQKQGLFAVKGRLFPQIIQKQRKVIARLDDVLTNENYSKIVLSPATRAVIKGMLCIDFNQRISPAKAIQILEAEKDL